MSFTFQAYKNRLQASYVGASSDISHISAPTISIIFYCRWFIESQKGLRTPFWRQDGIGRMKRLKLHQFWKSQSHLSRRVPALLRFWSKRRKMSTWLNAWKGSRTFSDSELSFLKTKKSFVGIFHFSEPGEALCCFVVWSVQRLLWLSSKMLSILFAPPPSSPDGNMSPPNPTSPICLGQPQMLHTHAHTYAHTHA